MLKNDTLKNGTSRTGLYGSAPPVQRQLFHKRMQQKSDPSSSQSLAPELLAKKGSYLDKQSTFPKIFLSAQIYPTFLL